MSIRGGAFAQGGLCFMLNTQALSREGVSCWPLAPSQESLQLEKKGVGDYRVPTVCRSPTWKFYPQQPFEEVDAVSVTQMLRTEAKRG